MFKKIFSLPKAILQKYLIGIIIGLGIIGYMLFNILKDPEVRKDIQEFGLPADFVFWIILIAIGILIITAIGWVVFLSFWRYTNKKVGSLERLVMFNINTICFLLVAGLTIAKVSKSVDIPDQMYLTGLGGIILFWWGYKKYQRDKEVDLLQNFSNKQSEILAVINDPDSTELIIKKEFKKLFELWKDAYTLQDKSYVSYALWEEWKYRIKSGIIEYIFVRTESTALRPSLSDIFLELLRDETRELYYQPNESSSYRFFVYFVEQAKKSLEMSDLFFTGKSPEEARNRRYKIEEFVRTAEAIISIPDLFSVGGMKEISRERKKIQMLLTESTQKIILDPKNKQKNAKKVRDEDEEQWGGD